MSKISVCLDRTMSVKKRYVERWHNKMFCPNIDSLWFKFRFFVDEFFIADLTHFDKWSFKIFGERFKHYLFEWAGKKLIKLILGRYISQSNDQFFSFSLPPFSLQRSVVFGIQYLYGVIFCLGFGNPALYFWNVIFPNYRISRL